MKRWIIYTSFILLIIWSFTSLMNSIDYFREVEESTKNSYLSVICLLLLEAIAFIVLLINFRHLLQTKLNKIIFLWLFYTFCVTVIYSDELFLDIRSIIWWPLNYFLFYYIARYDTGGKYIKLLLTRIFPILFFMNTVLFLYLRSVNMLVLSGINELFTSSNQIYYIALLLPFSFLQNKKISKYIYLIITLLLVMISFKRSALVFTSIIFIIAIYFDYKNNNKIRFINKVLISASILLIGYFSYKYIDEYTDGYITNRMGNMQEDQGSGRMDIYQTVWNKYIQQPGINQLIGIGFNNVRKQHWAVGSGFNHYFSSHNDFLEILVDFGIIGLIIYLIYIFRLIRNVFSIKRVNDKYYQANLAVLIIFFIMSMVSHLFLYPSFYVYLIIIIALTKGYLERLKTHKRIANNSIQFSFQSK